MNSGLGKHKRATGIDFDALAFTHAAMRHELRFQTIHQIILSDVFELNLEKDEYAKAFLVIPDLTGKQSPRLRDFKADLGDASLKQWKADQKIIESYHLLTYGDLDKCATCNGFGETPEAMYSQNLLKALDGVHSQLAKKLQRDFRKRLRCLMAQSWMRPVKLHPATGDAMGMFFDPETTLGKIYPVARFAYPCKDFPNFDPCKIMVLEKDDD